MSFRLKCFAFSAMLAALFCAGVLRAQENPGLPWPATDALGRALPLADTVGLPRSGRFVGIFYFIHHVYAKRSETLNGPYDVAKILALDRDALQKPDSPLWGSNSVGHYWSEPLFGYYRGSDKWVLRRHAQLLADAGVDVVIFDTTNGATYPETYLPLCEVFAEIRKSGGHTPQIIFMVNTRARRTAEEIYHRLYEPQLYRELWFNWRGKPLMICDPALAGPELQNFFTLRRAHWPFTLTNTSYAWHWEATYPQPYGFTDDPEQPEEVNVSVAQNLRAGNGEVVNMSSGEARGRSFHDGKQNISPGSVLHGYNFQEQWNGALELQPPFVMVTGWNEWTAGRWVRPNEPIVFVDQYDEEFSRDIEPMKGGHGDNYYWQLVANVRRYKGAPALPKPSPPKTMGMGDDFSQWLDVLPEFRDYTGDTQPRDSDGVAGTHYTDDSGRNDFALMKVARDKNNLYFYAQTVAPITSCRESKWMWLLLDTDQNAATGWAGYDFIVNRTVDKDGATWLEKNSGGWNWQKVAKVKLRVRGNEMQLVIPRKALGLTEDAKLNFDFKWADHLQRPGDIMDFYVSGDVAPGARFNFRFEEN